MKSVFLLSVPFLVLLAPAFCAAQSEQNDSLRNKIGFGGTYGGTHDYALIGSYSRIIKKENEICFSFYYIKNHDAQEIILGSAYYYSVFKKPKKFDLFLIGELNFNLYWFNDGQISPTLLRYGPNAYLGFVPAYNFSKRFSISLEFKIGAGYQWANTKEYIYNGITHDNYWYGWYEKGLGAFKLNYKF